MCSMSGRRLAFAIPRFQCWSPFFLIHYNTNANPAAGSVDICSKNMQKPPASRKKMTSIAIFKYYKEISQLKFSLHKTANDKKANDTECCDDVNQPRTFKKMCYFQYSRKFELPILALLESSVMTTTASFFFWQHAKK